MKFLIGFILILMTLPLWATDLESGAGIYRVKNPVRDRFTLYIRLTKEGKADVKGYLMDVKMFDCRGRARIMPSGRLGTDLICEEHLPLRQEIVLDAFDAEKKEFSAQIWTSYFSYLGWVPHHFTRLDPEVDDFPEFD